MTVPLEKILCDIEILERIDTNLWSLLSFHDTHDHFPHNVTLVEKWNNVCTLNYFKKMIKNHPENLQRQEYPEQEHKSLAYQIIAFRYILNKLDLIEMRKKASYKRTTRLAKY